MVGLLIAAVLIAMGVLGVGFFVNQSSSDPAEGITPNEIPTQRPAVRGPVEANQTIDDFRDTVDSVAEQQQQRVDDIEKQLLGQ